MLFTSIVTTTLVTVDLLLRAVAYNARTSRITTCHDDVIKYVVMTSYYTNISSRRIGVAKTKCDCRSIIVVHIGFIKY